MELTHRGYPTTIPGGTTTRQYYGHAEADRLIWTNTAGNSPPGGQFTTGPARAKYGYDDFGQMISRERRNPDGTYISQRLTWDGAGRLAGAFDLRRSQPIFTATYTPAGQRVTKSDSITPGGRTSSYGLHDTAGPTTHLPGGGMQSGTGKLYALTDRLGSTRATTTAQGVVSERVRYDAWGRITAQTGPVPVGTPLYAGAWGYEREPEGVTGLGLDYLTHRYYDPQIGRFISRDPIGWAGGLNLYGYSENDPVNMVDPLGLQGISGENGGRGGPITFHALPQRPKPQWYEALDSALGTAGDLAATGGIGGLARGFGKVTGFAKGLGGLLKSVATNGALSRLKASIGSFFNGCRRNKAENLVPDYITSPTGVTVELALANQWHRATFGNVVDSMEYHLRKHGNGRTIAEYTRDAQAFFARNKHLASPMTLKDGSPGLRIKVGTGKASSGGYWTPDGKVVTYWDTRTK